MIIGKYEGRDIAMSIYGLKESSSVYKETLNTLTVLEPFVRQFSGVFTVQNVAGTYMFIFAFTLLCFVTIYRYLYSLVISHLFFIFFISYI
jgi:hypothetical protein